MTIQTSRQMHPRDDARKARKIALSGGMAELVGDRRHLRRVRDALADDAEVETFLGVDDDATTTLLVHHAGRPAGFGRDRV